MVLGGGNVSKLKVAVTCCAGSNANAFVGGFRMWEDAAKLHAGTIAAANP